MAEPTPDDVRRALAPLDARGQKVVAGLLTVMIKSPDKVRDREWIAEQLTHLVLLAGDFEVDSVQDGVAAVQTYLQENAESQVTGALLLFQRVGLDMAPRAEAGFTFEEAMQQVQANRTLDLTRLQPTCTAAPPTAVRGAAGPARAVARLARGTCPRPPGKGRGTCPSARP